MAHDGWKIIVNVSAGKNFFETKFFPAPLYKKLLFAKAHLPTADALSAR